MILLTALFVPACSVANCKECSASDSAVYLTCETDFVVKENACQGNSFFVLNFADEYFSKISLYCGVQKSGIHSEC